MFLPPGRQTPQGLSLYQKSRLTGHLKCVHDLGHTETVKLKQQSLTSVASWLSRLIYPLTARVIRAPQMISVFTTSFPHFCLFSTAVWDLANSRPVYSLMLSSHLFLCLPCVLPPFTVPCKMVLAGPDEWETWPYHCSVHLFTMVRRSSCGLIACWARTSSLITWSLYEMRSILR